MEHPAPLTPPDADGWDQRPAPHPQSQRLVQAALTVGVLAAIAALTAVVLLYQTTRDAALDSLAQRNLEAARNLAHIAGHLVEHEDNYSVESALLDAWSQRHRPEEERFLCFVDREGVIRLHTVTAERRGVSAKELRLVPVDGDWPTTIDDLVLSRADWAGQMISADGERRISAFAYSRTLGGHLNIHVPEQAVRRYVTDSTTPVALVMGLLMLALVPLGAGLLLMAHRASAREAQRAKATLSDERTDAARRLAQLELFFQNPSVGFALVDRDLRYIRVNAALAAINGRSAAEHAGRTVGEAVPLLAGTLEPLYQSVIDTGEAVIGREIHGVAHADQRTERAWSMNFYPLLDSDQRVVAVAAAVYDITDFRLTERTLHDTQQRYRAIVETAREGVWMIDKDARTTYINPRLAEMLGRRAEDVIGNCILDDAHPDQRRFVEEALERRRAGQSETFPFDLHRPGGSVIETIAVSNPLMDDGGAYVGAVTLFTDVTERTQEQRQRAARNAVLEKLASGATLTEVLDTLTTSAELVFPDMLTSVLLREGDRLRHASAPSLPDFYNEAVDGLPIGPEVGSCGAAAALGRRVIVEDLLTHPNWASARDLAARAGLGACWSEPIIAADGGVLGTFAIYYREPRSPEASDSEFIESMARLASVAIERTRDAHALRESEERFRIAMDAANMAMWTIDLQTQVVEGSDEVFLMFGVPLETESPTLQRFLDRIHPDDLPVVEEAIRKTIEEDEIYVADFRAVHDDGRVRWLSGRGRVYRNADGVPDRFAGVTWDATELIEAQHALRESEDRLKLVMEATGAAVWDWDMASNRVYWSDRYYEMLGLAPEAFEPTLDIAMDLVHPDDRAAVREALDLHFANREPFRTEFRMRRSDAEHLWVESRGRALRNDAGEVVRMVGSIVDITDRKRAQDALRESEERFRQYAQNMQDVLWMADPVGRRILFINKAFEHIWGRSCDDLYNQFTLWLEAVHPDDRERVERAYFGRVLQGEYDEEYRIIRPDGATRWIRDRGFPIQSERGKPVRVAGIAEDITARKRAEAALRESERRFAVFMQNSPAVTWMKDAEGRYIYANSALLREYRKLEEEVIGKTDTDILPADVAQELRRNDLMVFDRWEAIETEEVIPSPEGRWRTWHIIKFPMADGEGRRLVGGFAFDITRQKQAEEALRLSDERFRTALKHSPLVVFNQDTDLRYTWVHNPQGVGAFEHIVGLCDDEIGSMRIGGGSLVEMKRRVIDTGRGARSEMLVAVAGHALVYDLTTEPLLDERGRVVGLTGAAMDITQRKRAEVALRTAHDALDERVQERTRELTAANTALRASEERFRSIFENSGVGVVLTDASGKPIQANPAFLEMMGRHGANGAGAPSDMFSSRVALGDESLFKDLAAGRRSSYQVERRVKRSDDQELWLRFTAQAMRSQADEFEAAVVIIENVTERKRAEETAQRRHNELAHASRFITVGELAAGLAHELNQPLAAIAAYADAASRRLAEPASDAPEPGELLGKISGQARRAGHIIHRMQDLVRKQEPKRSRFDLAEMLGETLDFVSGAARTAEMEIVADFPDDLPRVEGDSIQIQQVVLNLLTNALEVMPPPAETNGATRRITIRAAQDGSDGAIVSVEDTGPGFDDNDLERMFNPFHSTKQTGMGLGLTISRSIIEAHGGKLWAQRGERGGARFCFHLPAPARKAYEDER